MNEEEKAIEYIKRHIIPYYGNKGRIEFMVNDIILNLIDKQQKEIEELNEIKESFINQKKIDIEALEKKDNIIDLMAQELIDIPIKQFKANDFFRFTNKEDTKQYFIRKVEEDVQ